MKIPWLKVTVTMALEGKERNYSDDEIEQILGMGGPETKLALKEMRDTIRENPLIVAALIFAVGVLVGASLSRGHKRS
jgi:hypothetical protein